MKSTIVLFAVSVVVGACRGEAPRDASDTVQPATDTVARAPAPALDISCDQYVDEGLAVRGRSRAALRAELGEPQQLAAEAMPNRHDPSVTDTVFRMHYPGLTAQIRRPAAGGDMVERVDIRENRHLTYPALGIGASAEQIVDALGTPRERTDRRLLYACGREVRPEEPVVFLVANGRVEAVRFTYYVD